jgi:hypothetical protein
MMAKSNLLTVKMESVELNSFQFQTKNTHEPIDASLSTWRIMVSAMHGRWWSEPAHDLYDSMSSSLSGSGFLDLKMTFLRATSCLPENKNAL